GGNSRAPNDFRRLPPSAPRPRRQLGGDQCQARDGTTGRHLLAASRSLPSGGPAWSRSCSARGEERPGARVSGFPSFRLHSDARGVTAACRTVLSPRRAAYGGSMKNLGRVPHDRRVRAWAAGAGALLLGGLLSAACSEGAAVGEEGGSSIRIGVVVPPGEAGRSYRQGAELGAVEAERAGLLIGIRGIVTIVEAGTPADAAAAVRDLSEGGAFAVAGGTEPETCHEM